MIELILFFIIIFLISALGKLFVDHYEEFHMKILSLFLYLILIIIILSTIFSIIKGIYLFDYLYLKLTDIINLIVLIYLLCVAIGINYMIELIDFGENANIKKTLIFAIIFALFVVINCYLYPQYVFKGLVDLLF
jgi:hypothetical protein